LHFDARLPLVALTFCLGTAAADAHPHVMVEAATEVLFDAQGDVLGFRHHWLFDDLYSAYAAQGLPTEKAGQLTEAARAELAKTNLEGLRDFDFFTFAKRGKANVSFEDPDEGSITQDKGRLTLHFRLKVKGAFPLKGEPLTVQVYDPTYFVAFSPAEGQPARLSGAPQGCALDYQLPKSIETSVAQRLGAENFQGLDKGDTFIGNFAGRIVVTCK
jgi:ABC-type uncharacterized transport system substrate-binding protein